MKVTVRLRGGYKHLHPDPISVFAATAAEAIELVTRQIPGFKPDIHGPKRILASGYETEADLHKPIEDGVSIDLMPPLLLREKDMNIVQIVVGVVIIIVGLWFGDYSGGSSNLGAGLVAAGLGMVIGGVLNLLIPVRDPRAKEKEDEGRYGGSPPNTVGVSTRIPIGYGIDLVQGHVLSSDIDAAQI